MSERFWIERVRELEQLEPLEPQDDSPVCCPRHSWKPQFRSGQPRPPQSLCPECSREAVAARSTERPFVEVRHPVETHDVGRVHSAYDYERLRIDPPPGSFKEEQALELIDELRADEQERNRRQGLGVRGKQHLVAIRGRDGLRDYVVEGGMGRRLRGPMRWT
jgi:hypothetical protein